MNVPASLFFLFALRGNGSRRSLLRPCPQRSPIHGFIEVSLGVLRAGHDSDATLNSLFWKGGNYYRPVDLPDTTGLSWREGILRRLESIWPRSRISLPSSPLAVPQSSPPSTTKSSPTAGRPITSLPDEEDEEKKTVLSPYPRL